MLQGARRPVQVGLGVLATAAAVFGVLSVISRVGDYDRTNFAAGRASAEREELPRIISAAGGADHLLERCGAIATGAFQPPLVAWYLDAPLKRVRGTRQDVLPVSPTTFQVEGLDVPFQPPLRFGARLLVSGERWRLWSRRCTRRPQAATAGNGNSRRGS
jgi:hypothetical protein